MATPNPIKGSKIPVSITVGNIHGDKKLTDSDVSLSCVFFVNGNRNDDEKTVTLTKSSGLVQLAGSTDTYTAIVDTTNIGPGKLMCEVTVSDSKVKWIQNCSTNVTIDVTK